MSRPRLVFFGWENTRSGYRPKIYLRCLLFSTGKRGRIMQSMYLRVRRSDTSLESVFSFWGYGERNNLVPGSGLFVSEEGVAFNHHFLSSDMELLSGSFEFTKGDYVITIYADVLGKQKHQRLGEIRLTLSEDKANVLTSYMYGVLFDWHPDANSYIAETDEPSQPQALTPQSPLRPGL